jgi:hypothetical protein
MMAGILPPAIFIHSFGRFGRSAWDGGIVGEATFDETIA